MRPPSPRRYGPPVFRGVGPYLRLAVFFSGLALWRQFGVMSRAEENLLNLWLYHALIVVGFWFVFGVAGQFAFSQAAFVGLGAYLSSWATRGGHDFWVGFLVAGAGAGILAASFLLLVRRTSHFAFAITTLGLSEILLLVFRRSVAFTGRVGGEIFGVPPISLFGFSFTSEYRVAWLLGGALALAMLAGVLFIRSPAYRDAVAQRDQPVVAATLGVPVLRVRVTTFVLASVVAGWAGSLFVHWNGFASPGAFGLDLGLAVFLMLILGGMHSLWGPVLGAWFYTYAPQLLDLGAWRDVVYGGVLVATIVALPEGLVGVGGRLMAMARRARGRAGGSVTAAADTGWRSPEPAPVVPIPAAPVLSATGLSVRFGGVAAVDDVSLTLRAGEILGVIGPNGSGKTTLLNALSGIVPAQGRVVVDGAPVPLGRPGVLRRYGVLRTFQTPQVYDQLTCLENVLVGDADRSYTGMVAGWLARPAMLRHERARWGRARDALARVGMAELADFPAAALSYGQRRLLELARALAGSPRVVLLDEPSAGLNDAETEALTGHLLGLQRSGVTVLVVDHKIDFVAGLCDRVAVLELGRVVAVGRWEDIVADQRVIEAYLGVAEA